MRDLFLKLHLYGGLLCSSYLLIFGLSSLNYNHHFGRPGEEKVSWERSLGVENMDDNHALSERVRDELGLIGWTIPWETRRDEEDNLHFGLARPGKHYTIHVYFEEQRVEVEEVRKGFWEVINQLHALMMLPSSTFVSTWGIYTEVCIWVVFFSAASGVYLWASLQRDRLSGLVVLLGAAVLSVLFMVYVWWRG
jgi:hypothetical protein